MRPPEVFVRELSVEEGQRLRSVSRRARYQFKDQRVMTPHGVSDGHGGSRDRRARRLCRVARGQGDPCLQRGGARLARPHYRGGRPKKTTPAERDWIVAVARAPPPVPGGAGRFRRSVDRLRSSVGVELSPGGLCPRRCAGPALTSVGTRGKGVPISTSRSERNASCRSREGLPTMDRSSALAEMGPIQLISHQGSWAGRPKAPRAARRGRGRCACGRRAARRPPCGRRRRSRRRRRPSPPRCASKVRSAAQSRSGNSAMKSLSSASGK